MCVLMVRKNEEPVYCLVSSYNSSALQHVVVISALLVGMFSYLGLSFAGNIPFVDLSSFLILTALNSLIVYTLGRTFYYSTLTSLLGSKEISQLFDPTLHSVSRTVQKLMNNLPKNNKKYLLCFKRSFSLKALLGSLLSGLFVSLVMILLGYLALNLKISLS